MRKLFLLLLIIPASALLHAQCTLGETLKTQLLKDWQRAKAYTQEYMDVVPADKYGFKPQDSIRNFAQQMLHLAQANTNLSSNATGQQRLWNRRLEVSPTAQAKDSVIYFVNASYDYVIEGIKNIDASKLEEKVKAGNFEETKLAWLLKAFEHQTHQRGQTTIYIRMLGLKPPGEKLF